MKVLTGLDQLEGGNGFDKKISGKVGYLCHQASLNGKWRHGVEVLQNLLGKRLTKIFSPQHGFGGELQDNMQESSHFFHSHFHLPVYSLYSETRVPTSEMLEGLDSLVVDLQDVGTRIYTFITTLTYVLEACGKKGIKVIVLDRPNPIGGEIVEGNILDSAFSSFVGCCPLPTRHGLTMGEVALWVKKYCHISCELEVIPMLGYKRSFFFFQTALPWVPPSPNMPTIDSTFPFVGTVLFEGTSLSEGRGTTRPLETIGDPEICPWFHGREIEVLLFGKGGLRENFPKDFEGFILRPCYFQPTFQKHKGLLCGGFQIHVTNFQLFRPWVLSEWMCQYFYHSLEGFSWKSPPYEYEEKIWPIDMINGSDYPRLWVERNACLEELKNFENQGYQDYLEKKKSLHLYS